MFRLDLIAFARTNAAILVVPEPLGGFLVMLSDHGWTHGTLKGALDEARALADQNDLPIRLMLP